MPRNNILSFTDFLDILKNNLEDILLEIESLNDLQSM